MITAVDTSVLLDVFKADPEHLAAGQAALRQAIHEGALVACDVVWAELRPWFGRAEQLLDAMETLG
jgi:predicted nucleic acid-binding protein